jgi:triacylglycerol lipase
MAPAGATPPQQKRKDTPMTKHRTLVASFRLQLAVALLGLTSAVGSRAATFAETGTDTSIPIIFVHGWAMNNSSWDTLVNAFVMDGYPAGNLYRFGYSSLFASNKTSANQLANFVSSVRANYGGKPVIVIAHSNGGLVTRWYRTQLGGSASMKRFISLGSPHAGTTTARSCFSPACIEMRPSSTFLKTLNGQGCDVSLWSAADEIIAPVTSAQCGTSLQTESVKHIPLLSTPSVYAQIRTQL